MKPYFSHSVLLFKRLGFAFLIFSICRILFYIFNTSHFSEVPFSLFVYGLRFDLVSISYLFSPLILLSIIPFSFRDFRKYQRILAILFYIGNTLGIILNLIDLAYFDFTLKRSTTDFFSMVGAGGGSDFMHLFYLYVIDFWYDYIILAILIYISWYIYKKYCRFNGQFHPYIAKDYVIHTFLFLLLSGLTVIGTRGGLQYKPINIVNAGQYSKAENIPIVLNTPFTIIKTLFNDKLQEINYYPEDELNLIYTPLTTTNINATTTGKNVVLIILESYAKEYVGAFNKGKGYTPFLDSLINESYKFNNAYANGGKSIQALPAILGGLPSLMNTPYVSSNYSGCKMDGFPKFLKESGYNTSFYHGGANTTMGFSGFVGSIGIDNYYGLNQYPTKEKDYDGNWGIFDEPYLQYFAKELNSKPEPFFSTLFTVSSHHPYTIPKKYINRFPKGDLPLHETVGYTDFALKRFFQSIKKMSWYKNTLFVFTADHSSHSNTFQYKTRHGRFAIPTFIYDPSGNLKGEHDALFQHIDIAPTIMSLVGKTSNQFISFGNNAFDDSEKFVVNYVNSSYQIASQGYFLIFDGENSIGFFNLKTDEFMLTNLIDSNTELEIKNKLERKLKAIIQQHNNRLINNNLSNEL
jgi:phosphoglycerol transferase MdoB-like AlkP superfamily enzyme